MLSLESIIAINDQATRKARKQGLQPYVAKCDGDEGITQCPKLGYLVPKGWEFVQEFFVDKTGFGTESEPALTFERLLKQIKEGFGYGLGEEGQFQIYVREYRRIKG